MKNNIQIEICAGSLSDVISASAFEAVDRIELNCALELGGLTPSLHTLKEAKRISRKKLIAMVRPRAAGFLYEEYEKQLMLKDAECFLENGADGIVFGCLNHDHQVDATFTQRMCSLIHSYGREAVFHKAFDDARDLSEAAEALIRCQVDRVLTSGKASDALSGAAVLQELNRQYGKDLSFLPGGGVNEDNVNRILKISGCSEIHMSAKSTFVQDGEYYAVDPEKIRRILEKI